MILVIDNFDSFAHNVARYLQQLEAEVRVVRNNVVILSDMERTNPTAIVISPGPGRPENAGISMEALRHFAGKIPILGVCLGHQCIGEFYGGRIAPAQHPMHGQASDILHFGSNLFTELPSPLKAGRYHSLIVEEESALSDHLTVDARSDEGEIMALSHRSDPTYGIQFHPESVLTDRGYDIFGNFLKIVRAWHSGQIESKTHALA